MNQFRILNPIFEKRMSLPILKLAYLDNIRGFVAVGRRMSITQAAEDLCLTQSAVSRQIMALEEQVGVKLLNRGYRSIAFTEEGERLFRSADSAIQQLQDVLGEIKFAGVIRPVTLSASIGVTGLWLLPKLNAFQGLHPEVDLRVSANNHVGELRHDGIDLTIRYTTSKLAPKRSVHLFDEYVAPVAHPSLGIQCRHFAALPMKWPLLELDEFPRPWLQWRNWLGDAGWAACQAHGVLHFNQYDQVIQAALASQGIALGRISLIQPLLDEGKLVMVAPFKERDEDAHSYWLILADDRPRAEVLSVAAWIQEEATKTREWTSPI